MTGAWVFALLAALLAALTIRPAGHLPTSEAPRATAYAVLRHHTAALAWANAHPGFNGDLPAGSTPLAPPPEGWSSAVQLGQVATYASSARQPKVIAALADLVRDPAMTPPWIGPISGGALRDLHGGRVVSPRLPAGAPGDAYAILSEEKAK